MKKIAAIFALIVAFAAIILGVHDDEPAQASYGEGLREGSVPAEFVGPILAAARTCPEITAPLLAAQIEAESSFKVNSVSDSDPPAEGPSQFVPGTWAMYGVDANDDGKKDVYDPWDATAAQARYMCRLIEIVRPLGGNTVDFALASYNAGEGRILGCKCIPRNGQTEFYVPKIRAAMAKFTPTEDVDAASGGWIKPVARKYGVGAVFHQAGPLWSLGWHTGYDYVVPTGTDVLATYNGTVKSAGWGGAYGWHIVVDHGAGVLSTYSHLSQLGVHTGDQVHTGQRLGRSGNTGNTTGPHLHFEIKVKGSFVDPVAWLKDHAGPTNPEGGAAAVIAAARRQLGVPYVFGGGSLTGPSPAPGGGKSGFDCSSLTRYAWYTATGGKTKLPRVAHDQYGATQPITGAPQPGDLIFFKTGRLSGRWDHVGIYIGNGQMIHAPNPRKKVEIVPVDTGYYKKTTHETRRVTP
ncbi:peptidoglycan DD-metalloendopeptidase family protein [Kribbella sp. NPDC051587]|uniref:peptidoglycan DD-metalloendopeptidase family protein n=1 Tax=Kribbella sp. NPDC051587 TaxID=3364119 RepID=UPI0037B28633